MIRLRAFPLISALGVLCLTATAADAQQRPPRDNEQNAARENMLDRKAMPFSIIKRRVEREMADEADYVGVIASPREGAYRMQFLRKDGKVIWVDVDSKTGDIIARTK